MCLMITGSISHSPQGAKSARIRGSMIQFFQQWFETHEALLQQREVTVQLSSPTVASSKSAISASVVAGCREALILCWETGECDIHYVDMEHDEEVTVTHHEFASVDDLNEVLSRFFQHFV